MRRLLIGLVLAAACESAPGLKKPVNHSLDGFLSAPVDMAMPTGGTTTGGTTTGGTTTGGTTTGGTTTGGTTTGGTTTGGGSGLDPDLVPADGAGTPCTNPRSNCPGIQVCRFYSSTEGRCEGGGGGLLHDPCTASGDCDILFECYQGRCNNFCQVGTQECGAVSDCVDVGYMGGMVGVCKN